jgi:hypothetical protein
VQKIIVFVLLVGDEPDSGCEFATFLRFASVLVVVVVSCVFAISFTRVGSALLSFLTFINSIS